MKNLFVLFTCFSISGCGLISKLPGSDKLFGESGVFRDRQSDYLEAEIIPRTQILDGMDSYVIDDLLVVPGVNDENSQAFIETPRPRGFEGNPERGVVIQTMGEKSWVVIDASASQAWPQIQDYWESKSIPLSNENPTAGIMETGWFVLDGNELSKEKFRVIVEPGFQDDSSEINLLHMSQAQDTPSVLSLEPWPETSINLELENEILLELSTFLAESSGLYQASSVSFLAGNIPTEGKASIVSDEEGNQLLRLRSSYERSWAAIGRALARADVEIVSQDQNFGTYHVNYKVLDEKDEEPGFFTKVITLNGLFSGSSENGYYSLQIKLDEAGAVIDVLVNKADLSEDEEDNDEASEQAQDSLLTLLRNYIA